MYNSTQEMFFTLAALVDTRLLRHVYFMIFLTLYVLIMLTNLFLVVLICINRSLHEPMYVFLCSLFINELYGSTALFPLLLLQILSDIHTVSAPLCFLQIFCIYTYASVQFWNLGVMSYDRYLAICCPLEYSRRMSPCRVVALVALSWSYPCVAISILISLSSSLQLCGNVINKVYCDNYSIVKLSCSDTTVNNVYGMVYTGGTVCVVLLIFCSYGQILQVCCSGSTRTRQKALGTCSPHLASLLNFSCGCFFEIVQNRLDMQHVPQGLRVFLSMYWLSCQPLFNPLLYGLHLSKIRLVCRSLIRTSKRSFR